MTLKKRQKDKKKEGVRWSEKDLDGLRQCNIWSEKVRDGVIRFKVV